MPQVLLVDQSDRFVFKPMLYELLSGGMMFLKWCYCYLSVCVFLLIFMYVSLYALHNIPMLIAEVDAWEIAPRFSDLLGNTSIQFVQDRVKRVHPSDHVGRNGPSRLSCGGKVHLESGVCIEYDW